MVNKMDKNDEQIRIKKLTTFLRGSKTLIEKLYDNWGNPNFRIELIPDIINIFECVLDDYGIENE